MGRPRESETGSTNINVGVIISKHHNKGAFAEVCIDEQGIYLGASIVIVDGLVNPEILGAMPVVLERITTTKMLAGASTRVRHAVS